MEGEGSQQAGRVGPNVFSGGGVVELGFGLHERGSRFLVGYFGGEVWNGPLI